MQAIWRGAINFGLISIPVRLFSATEEKTLRFNMLHKSDHGRIAFNRTCKECGKSDLTKDDFVRGYEYEKGQYVIFEDEELDNVQIDTSHTVEVVHFTPDEQIDPIYYQKTYYLAPDELGTKAYALLRKSLQESDRVAVAKVAIRDKERLATLRVRDNVLVLETMYWPDEIREARFAET
ncbi:MAG: Ku protein, partial [Actinomycetota bacterium]